MRIAFILVTLVFEINLYVTESKAMQQQQQQQQQQKKTNGDNAIVSTNDNNNNKPAEQVVGSRAREIVAQKGGTATLPCKFTEPGAGIVDNPSRLCARFSMVLSNPRIQREEGIASDFSFTRANLWNTQVTWVRRRDRQLLTVGTATHSIDSRFMIRVSSSDWALVIRHVTLDDAGLYECQIATYPVEQHFVRLAVTEAYSVIPGAPDLHVKQGSSLKLECQLMAATEPPNFVFWYQQGRMINYDADPLVKVELTKNGSILKVDKIKITHGGNYTCLPSNAESSSVNIHVIEEEEKPAAMHGGDRRNPSSVILASNFFVFLLAAVSWRIPKLSNLYPT